MEIGMDDSFPHGEVLARELGVELEGLGAVLGCTYDGGEELLMRRWRDLSERGEAAQGVDGW